MKILFINFNIGSTAGINNGVAALSSVLKRAGHKVGLIFLCEELGYGFDRSRIRKDILKFKPDMIGISLVETQMRYMAEFCADLRRYYDGMVICGGHHPTMSPEDVLSVEGVDAVCIGEGEDALLELVRSRAGGRPRNDIRNIWFKSSGGAIVRNRLRPFKDLEGLPPEDKELFDLDKLLRVKNYQLEVMVGRGCRYRCAYCINGSYLEQYKKLCERPVRIKDYLRAKSADTVTSEIKQTISRHPEIRKIAFVDDNFLTDISFVRDLFRKYKKRIGLPFMCNVNPSSFDRGKGLLLKDAGCDDIRFGVESGSERVKRDIMKRPLSNRKTAEAFAITRELGLMSSSFNMIGLPTETKEEVLETLKLNSRLMPDTVKVMTFYPFKNTPLHELCEGMGLIDRGKKSKLDNYDTFTCLKFSPSHRLFLKKVQAAFNWYINVFLDNGASPVYKKMINRIGSMSEGEWSRFDFEGADRRISGDMKKRGIPHYSKFVNRSLAVKFPSRHLGGTRLIL